MIQRTNAHRFDTSGEHLTSTMIGLGMLPSVGQDAPRNSNQASKARGTHFWQSSMDGEIKCIQSAVCRRILWNHLSIRRRCAHQRARSFTGEHVTTIGNAKFLLPLPPIDSESGTARGNIRQRKIRGVADWYSANKSLLRKYPFLPLTQ